MRPRRTRMLVAALAASAVGIAPVAAVADPFPAPDADGAFVYVGYHDTRWSAQDHMCDSGEPRPTWQSSSGRDTALSPGSHRMDYDQSFPAIETYSTDLHNGVPLDELTRLMYSAYTEPSSSASVPPLGFRMSVDSDGDGTADAHLYFDPAYNADQQPPARGRWQEWDVLLGHLTLSGDAAGDDTFSLADYVGAHPDARLWPWPGEAGSLALIAGCWRDAQPQPDVAYYVDGVLVGVGAFTTAYRFSAERHMAYPPRMVYREDRAPATARTAYDDQTGQPLPPQSSYDWVPQPMPGSEIPPEGVGILSMPLAADDPSRVEQWSTGFLDFQGLGLIDGMTYQTWSSSEDGTAKPPPSLRLDVDVDLDDVADDAIYFFPADNLAQGAPANAVWQRWDAGNGLWSTSPDPGAGSLFTLREYALEHPHADIAPTEPDDTAGGGLTISVGGSQSGQQGAVYRVDAIDVTGFPGEHIDFEPPFTAPAIAVHPIGVAEGNDGATMLQIRVRLSDVSPVPLEVLITTHKGGTATPYADYEPFVGAVTVPTAQRSARVDIPVVADRVWEPTEYFKVLAISLVGGGHVTESPVKARILNDDTHVTLSAAPRGRLVDVHVATRSPQSGAEVGILRGTTVLFSGTLDDMGKLRHRLDKQFAPGAVVRLRARVDTLNGPYLSDPIVVRVGDR